MVIYFPFFLSNLFHLHSFYFILFSFRFSRSSIWISAAVELHLLWKCDGFHRNRTAVMCNNFLCCNSCCVRNEDNDDNKHMAFDWNCCWSKYWVCIFFASNVLIRPEVWKTHYFSSMKRRLQSDAITKLWIKPFVLKVACFIHNQMFRGSINVVQPFVVPYFLQTNPQITNTGNSSLTLPSLDSRWINRSERPKSYRYWCSD